MRKGQLLSIDALLSLVIVVMVVGVVMNTNDMIRAEITNLLDWYDRANIANNMLDVLTKNPGYPEDWEENVSGVKMIGLRHGNYSYALDYEKILALNRSKGNLTEIFDQLARGKDFMFEFYVSKFNVSVKGRFPRVYLYNKTFKGLGPGAETVNFVISTDDNPGMDPDPFSVSYIYLRHSGNIFINEEICDLISGNRIDLHQGDYLKFVVAEPVYVLARRAEQEKYLIPSNSIIEIYIDIEVSKGFQMNFGRGNCEEGDIRFSITGHGSLIITVSSYDNTFPNLTSTYNRSRDFYDLSEPLYTIAFINKTFVEDEATIKASMQRSPWIEPVERTFVFLRPVYNLSAGPSDEEPLVYGFMKYKVMDGEVVRIKVNSSSYGNLTLISQLGTEIRGFFVYGNQSDLNATLVWYEYENETRTQKLKSYKGFNGTITVPFKELFGSTDTQNKILLLWLYSLEGWSRDEVEIEFIPEIRYMLEPKFDDAIIKLLVWDDR
ncbi:hypothetical protein OCC_01564 [Thermococcus litoralis DSM 5473]|jgi:hypothetical protein|uniref:Uncharacterized protein n=1 Tax=Thermococcus litoralis (strain ATCC 51850 / DSM 5473 / JCM 8560 / NS-C) TaxID=523849 RepID=H3ZLN8_THELN|nr:hypothetical protein [Thermococcus litoralis]EHR79176.1 hypothetical protein OCC_01564 [Thermococcus litoralis DSM 5473]